MKRFVILVFLTLFCSVSVCQADDTLDLTADFDENADLEGYIEYYPEGTIFLDKESEEKKVYVNLNNPVSLDPYSVRDVKGVNYEELRNRKLEKRHTSNEYEIVNFSTAYKEKIGNFSYGTSYGADIDTGEFEYNTRFFTRYETKRFALQTAFGKDAYTSSGRQQDFVYVTPELHLGKGFVIKDTLKASTIGLRQKNEVILKYTPQFKTKENFIDFELGVGQVFYKDGTQKQVVRFETSLRL